MRQVGNTLTGGGSRYSFRGRKEEHFTDEMEMTLGIADEEEEKKGECGGGGGGGV